MIEIRDEVIGSLEEFFKERFPGVQVQFQNMPFDSVNPQTVTSRSV